MTKIQDVTGTAFIVAEYRAQENGEPNPLYRDPIVPLFLNERTRQAADRMAADFPAGEKAVKLRTRYFDEVASLYQTYWPNQPVDDSAFYNNYFLCTLTPCSAR